MANNLVRKKTACLVLKVLQGKMKIEIQKNTSKFELNGKIA